MSSRNLQAAVLLAAFASASGASPVFFHDQSALDVNLDDPIGSQVVAEDFTLADSARLTSVDIWLVDGTSGESGTLDSFSGTLSWAIYDDSNGPAPSLLASGEAVNLALTDAGFQRGGNFDLVRASFELDPPVALEAATYWLALHEGTWLSAFDGSELYWLDTPAAFGATHHFSSTPTAPANWTAVTGDPGGNSFVLYGSPTEWNESNPPAAAGGGNISAVLTAHDFTFGSQTSFSNLEAWLHDESAHEDGELQEFSGELSWALYENGAGKPGAFLTSGSSTDVDEFDSGINSASPSDIVRVRMALGRRVTLGAGTYWLALHEGSWLSPGDGSNLFWSSTFENVGFGAWIDTDPTAPGTWSIPSSFDSAFVLSDWLLFASGFEAGGACAWSGIESDPGLCP